MRASPVALAAVLAVSAVAVHGARPVVSRREISPSDPRSGKPGRRGPGARRTLRKDPVSEGVGSMPELAGDAPAAEDAAPEGEDSGIVPATFPPRPPPPPTEPPAIAPEEDVLPGDDKDGPQPTPPPSPFPTEAEVVGTPVRGTPAPAPAGSDVDPDHITPHPVEPPIYTPHTGWSGDGHTSGSWESCYDREWFYDTYMMVCSNHPRGPPDGFIVKKEGSASDDLKFRTFDSLKECCMKAMHSWGETCDHLDYCKKKANKGGESSWGGAGSVNVGTNSGTIMVQNTGQGDQTINYNSPVASPKSSWSGDSGWGKKRRQL